MEKLTKSDQVKNSKIESLLENLQETEARLLQLEGSASARTEQQEMDTLKSTLANKELMMKKALATAKKLKYQLGETKKELNSAKTQNEEITAEKRALEAELESYKRDEPENKEKLAETVAEETITVEHSTQLQSSAPQSAASTLGTSHPSDTSELSLELESLRTQSATYREVCQQLQQQLQAVTEEKHTSESQVRLLLTQVEQLEGVRDGLKLTVTDIEAAYQKLQEETERSQQSFAEEREELVKKCNIFEEQGEQWKVFMETLQGDVAAKEAKLQELGLELDRTRSQDREESLRQVLEQKDEKLVEVSSQLESVQNLLRHQSEVCDELKKTAELTEETLSAMRQTIQEQEEQLTDYESALSQSKERLQERETELGGLQESMHLLKADQESREQALQAQIGGLDRQIEEYKNKVVEMTAQLDAAQGDEEGFLTRLQVLEASLEERNSQVLELTSQLTTAGQREVEAQAEAESLHKQLSEQGGQVAALSGTVDSLKAQVEEARDHSLEEGSLKASVSQLQQQLEEQQTVISSLETRLEHDGQGLAEKTSESSLHAPMGENREELAQRLASYQNTVEQLSQEVMSLSQDNERLCGEMPADSSAALIHSLTAEKATLEQEKEKLREQLEEQLEVAQKMQGFVAGKLSQAEGLQSSYERVQSSMAALTAEKENLLAQVDALTGEIEGLRQFTPETEHLKEELTQVQAERDEYKAEVDKLRAQTSPAAGEKFSERSAVVEKMIVAEESSQQTSAPLTGAPSDAEGNMAELKALYEKTRSKLQVTEVKCEKMLIKLKSFKEKNDKLQIQVRLVCRHCAISNGIIQLVLENNAKWAFHKCQMIPIEQNHYIFSIKVAQRAIIYLVSYLLFAWFTFYLIKNNLYLSLEYVLFNPLLKK